MVLKKILEYQANSCEINLFIMSQMKENLINNEVFKFNHIPENFIIFLRLSLSFRLLNQSFIILHKVI
jgi:hypothetical protein